MEELGGTEIWQTGKFLYNIQVFKIPSIYPLYCYSTFSNRYSYIDYFCQKEIRVGKDYGQ